MASSGVPIHTELALDEPFGGVAAGRHDEPRLVVVEVVQIRLKAELDVLERLRSSFRDVHRADKAQAGMGPSAVPVRAASIVGDLPVRSQVRRSQKDWSRRRRSCSDRIYRPAGRPTASRR